MIVNLTPHQLSKVQPAARTTTPVQTPRKAPQKGPDKHSPLNSGKVPYRVGLSKRAKIEPLLRILKKIVRDTLPQMREI
jgi:hypothetical protein